MSLASPLASTLTLPSLNFILLLGLVYPLVSSPFSSTGGYLRCSSLSNSIVCIILSIINLKSVAPALYDKISSKCSLVILQNSYDKSCGICHYSGKMLKVAFGPTVASLRIRLNQANLLRVFSKLLSGLPGAKGSSYD